jgi:hypothetical protein
MPAIKHGLARLRQSSSTSLLFVLAIFLSVCWLTLPVEATGLNNRSLQLLNAAAGATNTYTISFTIANNVTIGSLGILLCSNDPIQDDICMPPTGLDVTNSQLSSQTGLTDFTSFVAAPNSLVLSRTPSLVTAPLTVTLTFNNVLNPSSTGSYYTRLAAYSSTNATGSTVAYGGLAFAITSNLQISSVVPPYLTFCSGIIITAFDCSTANGDYVDFGNLSSAHSSQAASQLLVATNAADGYVIQVYGTTMTSGNNIITAMTNDATSQPGTSQFGINLRNNTIPAIGDDPTGPGTGEPSAAYNDSNHYQFVSNDVIGSSSAADDFRKYTVSYVVNTSSAQAPGVYASTLTYVCAGSF